MADRFFAPSRSTDGHYSLEGDEARHLSRVRRVSLGDRVELFDGRGFATMAEVCAVHRDRVDLRQVGDPLPDAAAACEITLATAVPKGDRFDWLVEKATELGVVRVVPLITERSSVDPRGTKLDRLRRLVVEAAKQCGRNRLMELEAPQPWSAFLPTLREAVRIVAHPGGAPPGQWPRPISAQAAVVAIGPEGGFTDGEVDLAVGAGWRTADLGQTRLRIETACVAACSMLLALCSLDRSTPK